MTTAPVKVPPLELGRVGDRLVRPDGVAKVTGQFEYSSDLHAAGMLWGATLRSPHPRARIRGIDVSAAKALPGVFAVLTHDDVPGRKTYGMERPDQPVLAFDEVRYQGEPVAIVAADHPETARRGAELIEVDYDVLEPIVDVDRALEPDADRVHPGGNVLRQIRIRRGDPDATAPVVVSGDYEVGMQDQAFLGPESGLAIPDGTGGVDLYVATQWLHVDHGQVVASLNLPESAVRLHLSGVGGAFGGREDLSVQIHACMLALATGRPVKMVYSREESFFGHVHRHPVRMHVEHGADRDGTLIFVRAHFRFDGGAYTSSSPAVVANAASFAAGPYRMPNAHVDADMLFTNNPPCGAMRGFGAVQVAFAHEAQMDRLAAALNIDPVDLRVRNALSRGDELIIGQRVEGPAPVAEMLERLRMMPLPENVPTAPPEAYSMPGGIANVTRGEGVRRGVGYAVAMKNIAFSEGFDDYSTARVRLSLRGGAPLVEVHTAAAECGQGLLMVQAQIARTELGVENVEVLAADTTVGSSGSTSASRQTWMTGSAVKVTCEAVRDVLLRRAADELGVDFNDLQLESERVVSRSGSSVAIRDLLDIPVEETREYRHRETGRLDPETGQGDIHVAFAFAAHRVVVEVDVELGLVRVVEVATVQDVGKAINPLALEGQIQGGIAQGLGLALMEEIQVVDGLVRNASFTDYLLPTIADMPPVRMEILELAQPEGPYGANGVGEPPAIASTAAIVAALRDATGMPLTRIPVRPEHMVTPS